MKALILSFSRKKCWKGISYVQIVFGRDMFFLLLGGWVCYSPLQFIHDERNFGVLESQANKVTHLQHWRHFFPTADSQAGEQINRHQRKHQTQFVYG